MEYDNFNYRKWRSCFITFLRNIYKMVAYGVNKKIRALQKGGSIMDTLMKPFTVDKYNIGERHARSFDPNHFYKVTII